jgi:hypothetical protein
MKYVPTYVELHEQLKQEIIEKNLSPDTPLYIHRAPTKAYDNYTPIILYKLNPSAVCIECEQMTVAKLLRELEFHMQYYKQVSE